MHSALLWASSLVVASGCASAPQQVPEPVLRTVEVIVGVPTKCIEALPSRPLLQAPREIAAMAPGSGVAALGTGYVLLWDYAARLEAVAAPCVEITSSDGSGSRPR